MHNLKKFNINTLNILNNNTFNIFNAIRIKYKITEILLINNKKINDNKNKHSFKLIINKSFCDYNKINIKTNNNNSSNNNNNITYNKDKDIDKDIENSNINNNIFIENKDLKNKLLNKNFTFTKEDSNLNDLKFKEELFEYTANKSENINDEEIIIILNKLKDKKILEAEIKDFKFFIKNILSAFYNIKNNNNNTLKQSTFLLFIKYYLSVIKEIKIYLDPNFLSLENNSFDLFFDNINASILNKAITGISNDTKITDFIYFFQIINLINFPTKEIKLKFVEHLQINFLLLGNLNYDNFNVDYIDNSNIMLFLLENINFYLCHKIPLGENFIQILNFFTNKISYENNIDYYFNESFNKRRKNKKFLEEEINFYSYLYGILNEYVDNKNINKDDKDNKDIYKEKILYLKNENEENLIILKNLLRKIEQLFLFSNKITKKNLLKRYSLNKENIEKLLRNSIEDLYNDKESFIDTQMNSIMHKTLQDMKIIK
jgi:hypothetical protein